MSEELETTEEIRAGYAFNRYSMETAHEEFDLWYAEEIRKAKEEAWREGELAGTRNQRDFQLYRDMKITDAEYKRREAGRANPYRKEENE